MLGGRCRAFGQSDRRDQAENQCRRDQLHHGVFPVAVPDPTTIHLQDGRPPCLSQNACRTELTRHGAARIRGNGKTIACASRLASCGLVAAGSVASLDRSHTRSRQALHDGSSSRTAKRVVRLTGAGLDGLFDPGRIGRLMERAIELAD
jgi:hypothetical protein